MALDDVFGRCEVAALELLGNVKQPLCPLCIDQALVILLVPFRTGFKLSIAVLCERIVLWEV